MRIVQLTPGTGNFYCGNCLRDNALTGSLREMGHDVLLVPMIPTTLSIRTLNQLVEFLVSNGLTHVKFLPFFTMVDRRRKLHVDTITSFMKIHPYVMQSYIPYSAAVEKMGVERAVLAQFAPKSPGMVGYRGLWKEIKTRLGIERV